MLRLVRALGSATREGLVNLLESCTSLSFLWNLIGETL